MAFRFNKWWDRPRERTSWEAMPSAISPDEGGEPQPPKSWLKYDRIECTSQCLQSQSYLKTISWLALRILWHIHKNLEHSLNQEARGMKKALRGSCMLVRPLTLKNMYVYTTIKHLAAATTAPYYLHPRSGRQLTGLTFSHPTGHTSTKSLALASETTPGYPLFCCILRQFSAVANFPLCDNGSEQYLP